MSLLAPLYFLGALAISLPILFHLIRRQPQGEVSFSSLMFLRPTPPRLTRRSRLENWPLLLIRALILGLLAAAFARPLFRSVELTDAQQTRTATVLLIDTSASMKRPLLWEQSLQKANEIIDQLKHGDQLAVVPFDQQPQTLFSFDQSSRMDLEPLKIAARNALKQISPTWHRTDLGRAIRFAAELATSREDDGSDATVKVVLISDMQEAANVESLQAYSWPDDVTLDVRRVTAAGKTNAAAMILPDSALESDKQKRVRVRVTNSAHSTASNFRIGWNSGGGANGLPVQVPPGQSRVVRLPRPATDVATESLGLSGDDYDFDNQRFYVLPESREQTLLHIGPEQKDSRDSLVYYLQQAPLSDRYRSIAIDSVRAESITQPPESRTTPLVVIEAALSDEAAKGLAQYIHRGGRLLAVLADPERAESIIATCNAVTDSKLAVGEAVSTDYAMLSKIDFAHPIFAPMSDPPFNDFSKIRFWSHRSVVGLSDPWSVLASFDDGTPALLETTIGQGKVWILTVGWQPASSQLALSTKFVPLLFRFVDSQRESRRSDNISVGDPIPYVPSPTAEITTPGGDTFAFGGPEDLRGIDRPGVYQWSDGDVATRFAVNLSLAESRIEPIGDDALEQFGVKLDAGESKEIIELRQRQLRDRELEGRQRFWQWLLVAALVLLGLETWIGKRVGTRNGQKTNEPSVA